jgi:polysaccharide chain length determinant protein (PEP-CTERM system associated)
MWKYRWPALAVAWIVTAAGVVYVVRMPDVYQASARVHVDTQSILRPLMAGLAIQPNVQQQVALVSRTLISRPNVEKLVRMADIDLGVTTKAEQEQLITDLMKDLRISSAGRSGNQPSNLYNLSYQSEDRDKAQRVLEAMVSIFVESSLGATRRDQASARAFLDQQISENEQRMAEAEARLRDFQLSHLDRQLAEGSVGAGGAASRVQALAQQIDQTRMQLREAENARDSAKEQMDALAKGNGAGAIGSDGQPAMPDPSSIPVATPEIDARIAAIERSLDELLLRYTEQHPDVVRTRRLITDLQEQKAVEVARLREEMLASPQAAPGVGDGGASYSPFQQQMGHMVASAEVQVASLRARVGELTTRYNQAVAELRSSPEIEAQAAQLRRDYNKAKGNYEAFVKRRETADLSGELEVAPGMAEFRLIEPPRVGPKPVAPNRLAMLPVALLAGIGAALGLAFLASQLRPVFHDGSELRSKTQLPLIGIVSAVVSDVSRRRHRMELVSFWSASGSLLLLFMAGMAVMAWMANQTV